MVYKRTGKYVRRRPQISVGETHRHILRMKSSARREPTLISYSLENNIGHKSLILLLESDHWTRGQGYDETCLTFLISLVLATFSYFNIYQAQESLYPRLPVRTVYPPLIPVHRRSQAFKFGITLHDFTANVSSSRIIKKSALGCFRPPPHELREVFPSHSLQDRHSQGHLDILE